MNFKLPALPFNSNQVSSWLSNETLDFHYGRHHRAYVNNLNALLKGSGFEDHTLEEIVQNAHGPLFNNAAQAWNHTFYWLGMGRNLNDKNPLEKCPELSKAVKDSFGTLDVLLKEFAERAGKVFGSGWVWLVSDSITGKLEIISTANAENPMRMGKKPLLVCDVWEHAYYIDYRNSRQKYIEGFISSIQWAFVEQNLRYKNICNLTEVMTEKEPKILGVEMRSNQKITKTNKAEQSLHK